MGKKQISTVSIRYAPTVAVTSTVITPNDAMESNDQRQVSALEHPINTGSAIDAVPMATIKNNCRTENVEWIRRVFHWLFFYIHASNWLTHSQLYNININCCLKKLRDIS